MDPKKNPFAPSAGRAPPELAGRSEILERAEIALARTRHGHAGKGLLLVGLRGVGKTVLLNEIEIAAEKEGYRSFMIECVDAKRIHSILLPPLRSVLFTLDRMEGVSEKVKTSIKVLQGFISRLKVKYGDIEMSLDVSPETGVADSGDLEADLPELMVSVGNAAVSRKTAVALIFDEMQYSAKQN
jgi:Cdc6-like AAA superfamily ATPase